MCCVLYGVLGGFKISESVCKEKSYNYDWKYDYGFDVLMKKFFVSSDLFLRRVEFVGLGGICSFFLKYFWVGKGIFKSEVDVFIVKVLDFFFFVEFFLKRG